MAIYLSSEPMEIRIDVGRSVLVEGLSQAFAYASYLIRVRVNREKILPEYAAIVFGSALSRRNIRQMARSSAGNYNLKLKGYPKD